MKQKNFHFKAKNSNGERTKGSYLGCLLLYWFLRLKFFALDLTEDYKSTKSSLAKSIAKNL